MENKIPVPTDNIFKFYALFGLLLFVFSFGSVIYVNSRTNELIFATAPELLALRQITNRSDAEELRVKLLERRLEIAKGDKTFYLRANGALAVLAVFMAIYGFNRWHKLVQPRIDEMARTELAIAKLQLEKLRRELADAPGSDGGS